MIVKFLRRCGAHNTGELAGFPEDEAQRLIDAGFAALPDDEGSTPVPAVQAVDPSLVVHGAEPEDLAAEHEAFAERERREREAAAAPVPPPQPIAPAPKADKKKGRK